MIYGFRQLPKATGLNESIVDDSGPIPKALGWEIHQNRSMDSTLTGAAADYPLLSGLPNRLGRPDPRRFPPHELLDVMAERVARVRQSPWRGHARRELVAG